MHVTPRVTPPTPNCDTFTAKPKQLSLTAKPSSHHVHITCARDITWWLPASVKLGQPEPARKRNAQCDVVKSVPIIRN